MDPTQIYTTVAGGMLLSLFIYQIYSSVARWFQNRTFFYILKYLVYPIFLRRRRALGPISRWRILLIFVYWTGTGLCNVLGVHSLPDAGKRAGVLAVVHLIPLMFAGRLSFVADLLGLSLKSYVKLHGSFGLMAFVQGLIHVLIYLTRSSLRLKDPIQFNGFLVSRPAFSENKLIKAKGGVAMLTLTILSTMRRPFYEFFITSHMALAVIITYAMWRHLSVQASFSRIYVFTAVAIYSATTIVRYTRILIRNLVWNEPRAIAKLAQVNDAICVQVKIPRPWHVQPGQYIYVWMPGVSFWSFFQSHPFMITWWDHNLQNQGTNVYLLLKPQLGFTQKLLRHVKSSGLRVWVDGPYGKSEDVGDYGSLMMFASGIGIAAQIPYIKAVLEGFRDFKVRTRSILLVWQLNKESESSILRLRT